LEDKEEYVEEAQTHIVLFSAKVGGKKIKDKSKGTGHRAQGSRQECVRFEV
jgi:hypothetical protein